MKHAYLLIVHQEFEVLQCLLRALDDSRNDIFIHIDKKVDRFPELNCQHAGLFILTERLDVRWADVSQIAVELLLFKTALFTNTTYAYYHLLSGVDMPLQSQDRIHAFFEKHYGKEFIGFTHGDISSQLERKVKRYHLFPRNFREEKSLLGFLRYVLRASFHRLQELFRIMRHKNRDFKKGTNWVSVTQKFVQALVAEEKRILSDYRYTFCADEIFLHTFCWHSPFRSHIYDLTNEGIGSQRLIGWRGNRLVDWSFDDLDHLLASELMFARKFSEKDLRVVNRILKHVSL